MCSNLFVVKICFIVLNTQSALVNVCFAIYLSLALSRDHLTEAHFGVIILFILCLVVISVALLGCSSIIVESTKLLWMDAIVLFFVLAGKFLVYILIFHNISAKHEAEEAIKNSWKRQILGQNGMDKYQKNLECCGVNEPSDYTLYKMEFPKSCYSKNGSNNLTALHKTGCKIVLTSLLEFVINWHFIFFWIVFSTDVFTFFCVFILALRVTCKRRI